MTAVRLRPAFGAMPAPNTWERFCILYQGHCSRELSEQAAKQAVREVQPSPCQSIVLVTSPKLTTLFVETTNEFV
jgi:hypothetical protein